jgi:type I restriction enzyme M protein
MDKENANNRKAVFMIDASKGFMKDGPKNRLRSQDIHKIVDVFNKQLELPKYSRIVPINEIEAKEYNLNLPRYIDSQEEEDIQDIAAHLQGGIPNVDIENLSRYWTVYPSLKKVFFAPNARAGYSDLKIEKAQIKTTIFAHPEFTSYSKKVVEVFDSWKKKNIPVLKAMDAGVKPKKVIHEISEDILESFSKLKLIDNYDVYQHLMDYWSELMQDDCYIISDNGWKAELTLVKKTKKEEIWDCELVPKHLVINRFFEAEKNNIQELEANIESIKAEMQEMDEEYGGDEDVFAECRGAKGITKTNLEAYIKKVKNDRELAEDLKIIQSYLALFVKEATAKKALKEAVADIDSKVIKRYATLTVDEIKTLVVDDKWMQYLDHSVHTEMQRISQALTLRVKELTERYETPMPLQLDEVKALEEKVNTHLAKMGFVWS